MAGDEVVVGCLYAGGAGTFEAIGVLFVGDYVRDDGVWESGRGAGCGVDDGLEVGARAGYEDRKLGWGVRRGRHDVEALVRLKKLVPV